MNHGSLNKGSIFIISLYILLFISIYLSIKEIIINMLINNVNNLKQLFELLRNT